jgi:hypothetical protein
MGLRFKTESHGGQWDSSFKGRGTPLVGNNGDSFCRHLRLLAPRVGTSFVLTRREGAGFVLKCMFRTLYIYAG